jgi:cytidylate kinase
VVTIDGPGGSGKGTISAKVACLLGWNLLDSGALYRLVALAAVNHGVGFDNEKALEALGAHLDTQFRAQEDGDGIRVILEGEDVTRQLRQESAGTHASLVATLPSVRAALLVRQRQFVQLPGLVADGRDMGTVVFPKAGLKIFLTASAEERARRRYLQLKEKGVDDTIQRLLQEIQERDQRDMNRAVSPLRPAEDALHLDTTKMSIEEVVERVMDEVHRRGLA